MDPPLVGVIMGSRSDWDTMRHAAETLEALEIPHEVRVVSAHRTPDLLFEYAAAAEGRGLEVIIAGAGGAAHLPGMVAAKTVLPVLGVPVQSRALKGMDSLLSIVQMPGGVPVGTLAIGVAGANPLQLHCAGGRIAASRDADLRANVTVEFADPAAAYGILSGSGDLWTAIGTGAVRLRGHLLLLDPILQLMSRVRNYL